VIFRMESNSEHAVATFAGVGGERVADAVKDARDSYDRARRHGPRE
jgi:hypothetical protein